MSSETWLSICNYTILVGAILAALGGFGRFHFASRAQSEKQLTIEQRFPEASEIRDSIHQEDKKQFDEASKDREEKHNEIIEKLEGIGTDSYTPISPNLYNIIKHNLGAYKEKHETGIVFFIEIEAGNNNRHKVASDLAAILEDFNLGGYKSGNTNIGRFPDHAVTIFCAPENTVSVKDFIMSIEPYLHGEIYIENNFSNISMVRIYFNGDPIFYQDGSVIIE